MEKEKYYTVVKADHKLGKNDYVFGRIMGISWAMLHSDREIEFGTGELEDGSKIIVHECTGKQYDDFVDVIEKQYPDLCIFGYGIG